MGFGVVFIFWTDFLFLFEVHAGAMNGGTTRVYTYMYKYLRNRCLCTVPAVPVFFFFVLPGIPT